MTPDAHRYPLQQDLKCLEVDSIHAVARNGMSVHDCSIEAIKVAMAWKQDVEFEHNGSTYLAKFEDLCKCVIEVV